MSNLLPHTFLENDKTAICYDRGKKTIRGSDKTDVYNEPRFFTESKRGIEKAWQALTDQFTDETTMYGAINILLGNGIRSHSYCAVD
jgi:hypothetical protein